MHRLLHQALRHNGRKKTAMTSSAQAPIPGLEAASTRLMNITAALLLALVLFAALATALWRVIHLPAFAIAQIRITGQTTHSNVFTVRNQVLPQLRGNFFTIRLDEVRKAFMAQPWVRQATVRREFPNQLVVQLQEHEEAAFWGSEEQGFRLLNTDGVIFEANPDEVSRENLPELDGPDEAAQQVLATWRQLNPLLAPLHSRIGRLAVDARGSWTLVFDQDTSLKLGNASVADMQQRISWFVQTINAVVARYNRGLADVQYADLRYKAGYAIRLKGVGTLEGGAETKNSAKNDAKPPAATNSKTKSKTKADVKKTTATRSM